MLCKDLSPWELLWLVSRWELVGIMGRWKMYRLRESASIWANGFEPTETAKKRVVYSALCEFEVG